MSIKLLKNGINLVLDDGAKFLDRKTIRVFGENDWIVINSCLMEWESRGILKILKDPELADDADICVQMLKYIDRASPKEGWPS